MPSESLTIIREELYQAVWETPAARLKEKYGVSDTMLAKICKQMEIPKPPVGYWQRKTAGKTVKRALLPPLTIGGKSEYTISPKEAPLEPETVAQTEELKVQVPERLSKSHPLSKAKKASFYAPSAGRDWRYEETRKPELSISVTKSSFPRALRIVDTLFKALEGRGHKVIVRRNHREETLVVIGEETVSFLLTERRKQKWVEKGDTKRVNTSLQVGSH